MLIDFMIPMFDTEETKRFLTPISGSGGFQSLLKQLHKQFDQDKSLLRINLEQLDQIGTQAVEYGPRGGFQNRLPQLLIDISIAIHKELEKQRQTRTLEGFI
jgi:hypothetical protein